MKKKKRGFGLRGRDGHARFDDDRRPEQRAPGFRFRVSGFGFRISGFGFRISSFGFRVSSPHISSAGFGCGDRLEEVVASTTERIETAVEATPSAEPTPETYAPRTPADSNSPALI